jgi:subtilase family serine protease
MRTLAIAVAAIQMFAVIQIPGALAQPPKAALTSKTVKTKAMAQPTAPADAETGSADLLLGPVFLAKNDRDLSCSSTSFCGDRPAWPMEISAEVTNHGTAPSPAVTAVVRVDPGRNYRVTVPPLFPKTSYTIKVEHDFRTLSLTEVRVEIDPEHKVFSNENLSNILQMEIREAKPDLVITSFYAENRYVLQTAKFSITVTNAGVVQSDRPTTLKAVFVNSRAGTKTFEIPSLKPGQRHTVTTSHKYRSKGGKKINLLLDPDNTVVESNEGNNTSLQEFRIIYP